MKKGFLAYFIIFSPILDVLIELFSKNGISSNIGIIVRGLFLIIISLLVFINSNKENRKNLMLYYIVLSIYALLFFSNNYLMYGKSRIFNELKTFIKFFCYPIMMLNSIYYFKNIDNKKIKKSYRFLPYLYILLLLLPIITNTANMTYKYKSGMFGWFYSPNEVSSILAIISPFIVCSVLGKFNVLKIIGIGIYEFTILTVGTKAPILGLILSIGACIFVLVLRIILDKEKRNDWIKMLIVSFILVVSFLALFKSSALYKNIKKQSDDYNNYADKLSSSDIPSSSNMIISSIDNVSHVSLFPEKIYTNVIINDIRPNKVLNLLFSNRDILVKKQINTYNNSLLAEKLIGTGIKDYRTGTFTLVELDVFDILFYYGIVGFIIYLLPFVYVLLFILKYTIINFKKLLFDTEYIEVFIAMCVGFIISVFAGHVAGAPAVNIIMGSIIGLNYTNNSNQLKIMHFKTVLAIMVILLVFVGAVCMYNTKTTLNNNINFTIDDSIKFNKNLRKLEIEDNKKYYLYNHSINNFEILEIENTDYNNLILRNITSNDIQISVIISDYKLIKKKDSYYTKLRDDLIKNNHLNTAFYLKNGVHLSINSFYYEKRKGNRETFELLLKSNSVYEIYLGGNV